MHLLIVILVVLPIRMLLLFLAEKVQVLPAAGGVVNERALGLLGVVLAHPLALLLIGVASLAAGVLREDVAVCVLPTPRVLLILFLMHKVEVCMEIHASLHPEYLFDLLVE
jgi:hypothetical protein